MIKLIEFLGASLGIAGALCNALLPDLGVEAYSIWLGSSILLVVYAKLAKAHSLLAMNVVFSVINGLGLMTRLSAS